MIKMNELYQYIVRKNLFKSLNTIIFHEKKKNEKLKIKSARNQA